MAKYMLHEMNWKEVQSYLKTNDTLILPVGSTETHGSHLPVGSDAMVAVRMAEDIGKQTGVVVAPTLWYGYTPHHLGHEGTASISGEVYIKVINEICCSFINAGFKKIVIVNGHRAGNVIPIQLCISWLANVTGAYVGILDPFWIARSAFKRLCTSEPGGIGHGGEMETSHMLYLFPELVDFEKGVKNIGEKKRFAPIDIYDDDDVVISGGSALHFNKRSGASGMTGDATVATKEKGKAFHEALIKNCVDAVNEIKKREVKLTGNVPLPY